MTIDPLFAAPAATQDPPARFTFEGRAMQAPAGISVAAALILAGVGQFRSSAVRGTPRAPYCMMGVCFECLVEIDGVPARQSCLIPLRDGMDIRRQQGAADIELDGAENGDD